MAQSRFRTELTVVPAARISVARGGMITTVAWDAGSRSALSGVPAGGVGAVGDPRRSGSLPTDRFLIPGTRTDYGQGDVSRMTSPGLAGFNALLEGVRARRDEIVADTQTAKNQLLVANLMRALGWITLVCAVHRPTRRAALDAVAKRKSEIATLAANLEATPVKVDFDMDSEIGEPQRSMQEAFDRMASCQRRWSILSVNFRPIETPP